MNLTESVAVTLIIAILAALIFAPLTITHRKSMSRHLWKGRSIDSVPWGRTVDELAFPDKPVYWKGAVARDALGEVITHKRWAEGVRP